jgi:hypothetical protein
MLEMMRETGRTAGFGLGADIKISFHAIRPPTRRTPACHWHLMRE